MLYQKEQKKNMTMYNITKIFIFIRNRSVLTVRVLNKGIFRKNTHTHETSNCTWCVQPDADIHLRRQKKKKKPDFAPLLYILI